MGTVRHSFKQLSKPVTCERIPGEGSQMAGFMTVCWLLRRDYLKMSESEQNFEVWLRGTREFR